MYCHGFEITLMDGVSGPTGRDLGDVILEYNELNTFPKYVWPTNPSILEETHGVAGFLGVFGNIATCNFIHGALLLQLSQDPSGCGCAGDDAVLVTEDPPSAWAAIANIGIMAPEKTFSSDDGDVVYLKRRTWIDTVRGNLNSRPHLQLPSFLWAMSKQELSRFREASLSRRELLDLAASSLQATFRSVSRLYRKEEYLEDIREFLSAYYACLGFPPEGNVPQLHQVITTKTARFIPTLDALGSSEFIIDTLYRNYSGRAFLPVRDNLPEVPLRLEYGTTFQSRGGPYLTYLMRLGLVKVKKKVIREYAGEEGLRRLVEEWSTKDPAWVEYEVVHAIPTLWGGTETVYGQYVQDYSYLYTSSNRLMVSLSGLILRSQPPNLRMRWFPLTLRTTNSAMV